MLSLNQIFFAAMLMIGVITFSSLSQTNSDLISHTNEEQKARTFLIYVETANSYFSTYPNASGDITSSLSLPSWLAKSPSIKAYAQNGRIFVYTNNTPNMVTILRGLSYNSASLGTTNGNSIILSDGRVINKPAVINFNAVVFMI